MTAPPDLLQTSDVIDRLFEVIESRKGGDASESYTASLFSAGSGKICQKLGEEATETIVAALEGTPKDVISESADLLYHLLVLWAQTGVTPDEVRQVLSQRQGMSGLEEKKSRK